MQLLKTCLAALALACAVILSACKDSRSSSPAAAGTIKIGFIVKQPDQDWFQREWRFADEAAKADGFELIRVPAPDGQKVLDKISELSTKGAKGFVICTPQTTLGPSIVSKAKDEGLKVIAVDDQFVDKDGKAMTDVVYLGIAAKEIGLDVGKALADEMTKRKWPMDETGVCAVTYEQIESQKLRVEGTSNR